MSGRTGVLQGIAFFFGTGAGVDHRWFNRCRWSAGHRRHHTAGFNDCRGAV